MASTEAPRCLIVDEHPVVRAGVRALLEGTWNDARIADAESVEGASGRVNGASLDGVADKLGLSTETIRTHTKRILAKLEASTRTQAVAIGIRHGLIE